MPQLKSGLLTLLYAAVCACASTAAPSDVGPRDAGATPLPTAGCDACVLGALQCVNAGTVQECVTGEDGCPTFESRACVVGFDCNEFPEACAGRCESACEAGDLQCAGAAEYRECVTGPEGCGAWEQKACAEGTTCGEPIAPCVGSCENACEVGEMSCAGSDQFRRCDVGEDGCTDWAVEDCIGGTGCLETPDACMGGCENICRLGTRQCAEGGTYDACVAGGLDGCTVWENRPCEVEVASCSEFESACTEGCGEACEPGTVSCQDEGRYRECVMGLDGCGVQAVRDCAFGTTCGDPIDACVGRCVNDCVAGETRCSGGATYERCVVGDNGCNRWEQAACEAEVGSCEGAPLACRGECPEQCAAGSASCVPGGEGWQECVIDADGCYGWVARNCVESVVCADAPDRCLGRCTTDCEIGQLRCPTSGDVNVIETCARAENGCLEWQATACANDVTCDTHPYACAGQCENACRFDDRNCTGAFTFRECYRGSNGCTLWRTRSCAGGVICEENPSRCMQ